MASLIEPASTTASSATHQSQAEATTASSMPEITQLSLEHSPDIFTIICFNDSFQLALDHSTIKTLLRVCKRARPLLSSKLPRFNTWCQNAELYNPDRQMQIGLTPSDKIALSLHCEDPVKVGRSWLIAQADQGNAASSYLLARFLQAELVRQTFASRSRLMQISQRIFHLLEAAANADHAMAKFHLAGCYHDGIGVDKDQIKAIQLYRSLAEQGIPRAQIALGQYYESGEGVDQDLNTAIDWYSKAADQGSDDGRLHIVCLRGWFSFLGHGVEQSDEAAFNRWQEVRIQSTDQALKSIATHMVGWMHYLGRGTVRDEQKGIKIIRDSKSDRFPFGEEECLANEYGASAISDSHASQQFFGLCQLGSDRDWLCMHLIAVCIFFGFGTKRDHERAASVFERLANEGRSDSQFWIGECHYGGHGASQDYEKAFEWYSKSANQGNSYGQWMVGVCFSNGEGVAKVDAKAIEWLCKSAEQGNRYGQDWLGDCYEEGWGVTKNIDTAVFWFRKSADQGYKDAICSLKCLNKWE